MIAAWLGDERSRLRVRRGLAFPPRLPSIGLDVRLSASEVSHFNDFQARQRPSHRRSWIDAESGFERANLDARTRNPKAKDICRCTMRLLERGTEPARCAIFFRRRDGARGFHRAEFYQRRLFH